MHYRGLLRVARREAGTRIYEVRTATADPPDAGSANARFDALIDIMMNKYAPLPAQSLCHLASLLGGGAPQWRAQRASALARAKQRFAHVRLDGIDWYWPATESPASSRWRPNECVRLVTPFDPLVWDRRRFNILWGWAYRFEAYTPPPKRKLGYYALPLLWHDRVIGWGNLSVTEGVLRSSFGYTNGRPPREAAFRSGRDAELARMRLFLGLS
jgi:uncharacterized protein YcaQ